jgi:hypothetical protein
MLNLDVPGTARTSGTEPTLYIHRGRYQVIGVKGAAGAHLAKYALRTGLDAATKEMLA